MFSFFVQIFFSHLFDIYRFTRPWWHITFYRLSFFATFSADIINSTMNIQWSKFAADIQVMMNHTGTFVSETVWASDLFQATMISVMFLIAYWSIIYLDSSQPGVNPPSPLAAITRKKWKKLWTFKNLIKMFISCSQVPSTTSSAVPLELPSRCLYQFSALPVHILPHLLTSSIEAPSMYKKRRSFTVEKSMQKWTETEVFWLRFLLFHQLSI